MVGRFGKGMLDPRSSSCSHQIFFSGELNAYYNILEYPSVKKFELRFKDGWLHDTIRIWNDWGELQLMEV